MLASQPSDTCAKIFCFVLAGKKCTYGIKCKFHHPERVKQSNHSLGDEVWVNTKHPSTTQKQSAARSSPVPGQSLSQLEDMAKKLTLGHESSFVKKDHKNEQVVQVKVSHRSSKRTTSRKEKTSQQSSSDRGSVRHGGSQEEQLDSGLGSIDSQPMEAPWSVCDQQYQATYNSVRQQYCPPRSAPGSLSSHSAPSPGSTPVRQHHQHHSIEPISSCSPDMTPYSPHHYPSYGTYPVRMPAYSQLTDFQHTGVHSHQQPFWSGPFGAHPQAVCGLSREHSQGGPPQRTQLSPSTEEREVVRKKLLAIFSSQLVDTVMDMFPQMIDPQMLVAEILMLQSQNRSLR